MSLFHHEQKRRQMKQQHDRYPSIFFPIDGAIKSNPVLFRFFKRAFIERVAKRRGKFLEVFAPEVEQRVVVLQDFRQVHLRVSSFLAERAKQVE